MPRIFTLLAFSTTLTLIPATATRAADPLLERAVARGIGYLQNKGQAEDGSYTKQTGIGITALVTTSLLRNGRSPREPLIASCWPITS